MIVPIKYYLQCAAIATIIIVVLFGFLFLLHIPTERTMHPVWKSTTLSDAHQFDSLSIDINTWLLSLRLIDPHRASWKFLYLQDSIPSTDSLNR